MTCFKLPSWLTLFSLHAAQWSLMTDYDVLFRFDDHYRAAEAICGMHGENLDGSVLKVGLNVYKLRLNVLQR